MKGVKNSLFACQVSGAVPASLHAHLSFLPMRCLSQPLPLVDPLNSNRRPPLTASAPVNACYIFTLSVPLASSPPSSSKTYRWRAICFLCASPCANFLPKSVSGRFSHFTFNSHLYGWLCTFIFFSSSSCCNAQRETHFLDTSLKFHLLWYLTKNVHYSSFIVGLQRLNYTPKN